MYYRSSDYWPSDTALADCPLHPDYLKAALSSDLAKQTHGYLVTKTIGPGSLSLMQFISHGSDDP